MTLRAVGCAVAGVLLLLAPATAETSPAEVNIQFAAFGPSQLDVLPGESVAWTNASERTHTVTSDTGLFDSGDLVTDAHFAFRFDQVGSYRYHCLIHPSMVGEVDVRRVILDTLPTAAVPAGAPVEFSGRAADATQRVDIERSLDGSTFATVATATPAPDGTWQVKVDAQLTGDYRAVSGSDASETRRLLVGIRRVRVHATRNGIGVAVSPSAPYFRFNVEVHLRERFGWWPVANGRLDYVSEAEIRVRRPARVRVVLVDKDGWTPLATSPIVVLGKR